MNTKKFIVWSLLLGAIVVAVAAETSIDNKKGAKQVDIPTVERKNDAKDSLNQGDVGVEATVENEKESNYEVNQRGWKGGGGGGWKGGGGGGKGGGGGGWKGGGGGGWKGGGGRGGGGGWSAAELDTEETNDASYEVNQRGWKGGGGGGWKGGGGGGKGGGGGGWKGGGGGWSAAELDTEETNDASYEVNQRGWKGGGGGGWKAGGGGGWKGGGGRGGGGWKGGGGRGGGG